MTVFLGFHYKNGTDKFNSSTLDMGSEFTDFMTTHYIDATNMSDLLAAFPLTNRNVGHLPEGWTTNGSGQSNTESMVNNAIDNFRRTQDIGTLESELSRALNKRVSVEELGSGVYGEGFKIDVEGATPVVLK
mgnify:CR=1 FL=1